MNFSNKSILLLILIISIILRFFNYFEIPFTYDEFSAFFRLNFDNFSELIDKGVKIDAHPAGIHVLMYYWSKIFGNSEWIIKLPFTIFGIVSIYLIYKIAKVWFNETVGLISASYLATIQFTVMYSQIARPYMSGMFFSLVMIYYWSQLIKKPDKNLIKNTGLFILGASLCAYNHHFSLLFAAIVGISGLFFINRQYLMWYIISGLIIFIFYLPHLEIFFYQLQIGGVGGPEGWLSEPENNYIFNYLKYIFNFSYSSIIITLLVIIYGVKKINFSFISNKTFLLFLSWFLLPFLIGFFYSKFINPVLQFSVLIFNLPVLFFLLFGHFRAQKATTNLLLVLTILSVNITSLVIERDHYNIFYQSFYEQVLLDYKEIKEKHPNSLFIIDSNKEITKYYCDKLNIDNYFLSFNSFKNKKEFHNFLKRNSQYDRLFFGCLYSNSPYSIPIIKDVYPNIKWQKNYAGGTTYFFNKSEAEKKIISNLNSKNTKPEFWSNVDLLNKSNKKYLPIIENVEWGPTYTNDLNAIINNENNFIHLSVKAKSLENDLDGVILVSSLDLNGKNIYWSGTNFKDFKYNIDTQNNEWVKIHHCLKLSDIKLQHNNIVFKAYIWNKEKKNLLFDDFEIELIDGNPIIYGLNQEI